MDKLIISNLAYKVISWMCTWTWRITQIKFLEDGVNVIVLGFFKKVKIYIRTIWGTIWTTGPTLLSRGTFVFSSLCQILSMGDGVKINTNQNCSSNHMQDEEIHQYENCVYTSRDQWCAQHIALHSRNQKVVDPILCTIIGPHFFRVFILVFSYHMTF